MRSALLILATLALLVGGFLVYTFVQPSRPIRATNNSATGGFKSNNAQPATAPANPSLPIGAGENAYIERYDPESGLLASRFRAARYDPQPDGTVNVDKPEAEFYLSSRQRDEKGQPIRQLLRLRGDRGEVVVPANGATGTQAVGAAQMPTRGKLHNVTLTLFQNPRAAKPTLTCRVDNLAFDNDTFRIATEAFTDARGKLIDADQVPISVRGVEYDFDGRGLTILWDEKDRHLQLLEVAHGQVLTVKKPGAFGAPTADPASPRADAAPTTRSTTRRSRRAGSGGGASTNPIPQATSLPATAPTTSPTTSPAHEALPYRATFAENVVITQDNVQIASADILNLDFLNDENGDRSSSATASSNAESTTGSDERPTTRPTTRKTAAANRTEPTTAPSAPEAKPIVVRWTGKLTVTAAPTETPLPAPGDTVFELVSITPKPVELNWQGSRIVCGSLRYHSLDDSAAIRSGDATPFVHVTDERGMNLQTPKFDYDGASRIAVLRGVSHADLPIASNDPQAAAPTTRPAQFARVDWSDRCTLHLANTPGATDKRAMAIESADVLGDVRVKSPQMDLASNRLQLTFDSTDPTSTDAAANPDIRELIATGSVRGVVRNNDPVANADAKPQSIDSERLNIQFDRTSDDAKGRSYPKQMIADGSVRTSDGASELRADHLEARFAPTTQPAAGATTQPASATDMPSIQIVEMDATGGVRARGANGEFAEADQLRLVEVGGRPSYTLTGPTAKPARVGNDKSTMTGPIINLEPDTGKASVLGPGSLHAVQQQSPGTSTRPVDVTWSRGLDADEANNRININGDVIASSVLEDGSTNVARGATMTMTLADAPPTTRPTTKPATTRPARSTSGFAGALSGGGAGASHDKIVRSITLVDPKSVEVESTLTSANKTSLRRIFLSAPTLQYEMQDKRLVVPVAGRMLYEDQRPAPTTRPATQPGAAAPTSAGPLGESRGKTAFQWQKEFTYSDAEHLATMTGGVIVVHQSPAGAEEYRLIADRVSAETEPNPPSNAAANADPSQAKLKRMTADGGVMLTSKKLQFNASHVEFDAVKNRLIARSAPGAPATLYDESGLTEGTFDELYHDTITGKTQMVNFRGAVRK